MKIGQDKERRGILNETTMTLHKQETGMADFQAPCGHTAHVPQDRLRIVEITHVIDEHDASRCGRCFEDGRGY